MTRTTGRLSAGRRRPPTSAADAIIEGSPSADIIAVDTADAANSLTLSDANATLDIDGASASLSVGSLAMSAGALNVSSSRDGGLLALNGGTLDHTGGTLTLGLGGVSNSTLAFRPLRRSATRISTFSTPGICFASWTPLTFTASFQFRWGTPDRARRQVGVFRHLGGRRHDHADALERLDHAWLRVRR